MEWVGRLTTDTNEAIPPQFDQTLKELIKALIKPETLKRDLFFALLLIVIKENDFVQRGNIDIDVVDCILDKRRNRRKIYQIPIVLYPFIDTPANIIVCALNDTMLINAIVDATKETHSLCLPINEHLTTSPLGIPSAFTHLDALILSLKENIVYPVKNSILSYHSQPCGNLYGLPDEALFDILLSLPISDILNVAKSSKKLYKILKHQNLWSRLFTRDFPKMRNDKNDDWCNVYKQAFVKNIKRKAERAKQNLRDTVTLEEIDEWPDYMPVRDSRWEVIL